MKNNTNWKKEMKRIIVICAASVLMALNIKTFVRTGDLYPGGVTGMTLLIQHCCEKFLQFTPPYSLVNLLLNLGPVYVGYRYIGKKFTMYSCLVIILNSILVDILPAHIITYDILLICIFGGIINGFVISMCLQMDATSGGLDFIAIFLSEKKGVDSWNMIFGINVMILGLAGILFGWNRALYSIIFQFASTQVLHMRYKRYQQQTLFIVTDYPKEVYKAISQITHHGATLLHGEGSYEHKEKQIIYSVVSSEESKKVVRAIKQIDEKAFINIMRTEQLSGRFYKRPNE